MLRMNGLLQIDHKYFARYLKSILIYFTHWLSALYDKRWILNTSSFHSFIIISRIFHGKKHVVECIQNDNFAMYAYFPMTVLF